MDLSDIGQIVESTFAIAGAYYLLKGAGKAMHEASKGLYGKDKIGKIELFGPILPNGSKLPKCITPKKVEKSLKAAKAAKVKGLLLHISSPGGVIIPSKEIGEMIKEAKVPKVAYVNDMAASGGYWLASACDKIVADEYAQVGSIGVISPHIELTGLAEKLGLKYESLKTCEYKDIGSMFREMSDKERAILQETLEWVYEKFINEIATNRKLDTEHVRRLANGLVYTCGINGLEDKLIDAIGNESTAVEMIEELGEFKHKHIIDFTQRKNSGMLGSVFGSLSPYNMGMNIARGMMDTFTKYNGNIR